MIIGVDVDEVLRQFVKQLQHQYGQDYPERWMKPVTAYDLDPFFEHGKDIYEYFDILRARTIYQEAPPFDGAKRFVEILRANNEVWLVSSQRQTNEKYTMQWIENNHIPYDSVAFTRSKHTIDLDILIDDSTKNLNKARDNWITPIAMARPWNEDFVGMRARDYDDCLEMVSRISTALQEAE